MPLSELDSGSMCYRSASPPSFSAPPGEARASARGDGGATRVKGPLAQRDAFVEVLLRAGLADAHTRLPEEAPLSPEDAAALFDALLERPVTVAGFGPRLVASRLLREVVEGDEELPRAEVLERLKRFERLAVLRPDGYLAMALTGATRQRVGEVRWNEGSFHAGPFEVGAFYSGATGVWRPVDSALQLGFDSPVLAEVRGDASVPGRELNGGEETSIELVLALGQLVTGEEDSATTLSRLPEGLATLIASSPGYLERFRQMTRGERIHALSRLTTTLLATWGTAVGTSRTLAARGRDWEPNRLPVLSLAADGSLAVERVAVPVGRTLTVLGTGAGATVIPHTAVSQAESFRTSTARGPGRWGPARESRSPRAARYHEQLSGRPASEAYWLGEPGQPDVLKFDGFEEGVLLEVRGPGLESRFNDDLTPRPWFASGARALLDEALRKHEAAQAAGVRVRWHVAEEKAARALRKLFEDPRLADVEVVQTPALP
ncbi:Tox-REase-5 domain-containing protein [Myxococcus sp. RHSTA-1-4]|uniref:Tox-REase-5 domain-containing protein n=1 Tax=Myxococcus sp. RHSTA-1-4 TaxID=2874601 RepID=UPI001CBF3338|nr:Tox-REase-5 domain-containing protein [Myxococcus sp. RHSTA-1-4]MBZ4416236.1 hypothetical protein [Myxococcus sp. RHSTA-1-4]